MKSVMLFMRLNTSNISSLSRYLALARNDRRFLPSCDLTLELFPQPHQNLDHLVMTTDVTSIGVSVLNLEAHARSNIYWVQGR